MENCKLKGHEGRGIGEEGTVRDNHADAIDGVAASTGSSVAVQTAYLPLPGKARGMHLDRKGYIDYRIETQLCEGFEVKRRLYITVIFVDHERVGIIP